MASTPKTTENAVLPESPTASPPLEYEQASEEGQLETADNTNNNTSDINIPEQDATTTSDGQDDDPEKESGPPPPTSIDGDGGLRPNGIILICLGSGLLVILAIICWRRRQRQEELQHDDGAAIGLLSDPGDESPSTTV